MDIFIVAHGWDYQLSKTCRRKSAFSWLHVRLHSTCNIYWDPCLPHLLAIEASQAMEKIA